MQDIQTEKTNEGVDFSQPDLAIFSLTLEGKVTDISRAGVNMLGYTSREKILKSGVTTRTLFFNARDGEKVKEIIERLGYVKDCELAGIGCGFVGLYSLAP